jgi:prepilin-type N-terminal cleavage/methylation domain-containing protein
MAKNLKNTGFTLAELMIVVAIVGILAAVALPSLSRFMQKKAVEAEVNKIASVFKTARSEALAQATNVSVNWSGVTGQIRATLVNTNEMLLSEDFTTSVARLLDNDADDTIQFNGQGRSNQAVQFAVCGRSGDLPTSFVINLVLTGRVSIVDNRNSAVMAC